MTKAKKLTRRQHAVIEDLFTEELDEEGVLEKHNVNQALYSRWLADERFTAQFDRRLARAYRAGHVILARYAPVAAAKLVALTNCKKEETARKACLDIISLDAVSAGSRSPVAAVQDENTPVDVELPPEIASRILTVLASGSNEQ